MEKNFRIYRYTNILNDMKYIGKTCRKWQCARSGHKGSQYIYNTPKFGQAILEDGWENFKYEVLEEGLNKEQADKRESYWIEKENSIWPNGYNLQSGGKRGFHNHEVTCKKLEGHLVSFETRNKISKKRLGIKFSEETKAKMSESNKGRFLNRLDLSKRVQQFTKDGQFVDEYPSMTEAQRQTGIPQSNIGKVCMGERITAGGFIWKCPTN